MRKTRVTHADILEVRFLGLCPDIVNIHYSVFGGSISNTLCLFPLVSHWRHGIGSFMNGSTLDWCSWNNGRLKMWENDDILSLASCDCCEKSSFPRTNDGSQHQDVWSMHRIKNIPKVTHTIGSLTARIFFYFWNCCLIFRNQAKVLRSQCYVWYILLSLFIKFRKDVHFA